MNHPFPPLDVTAVASYVLMHARGQKVTLDRATDLRQFMREGDDLDEKADFMHIFRRLKIMCRLFPWPAAPEETAFLDLKIGNEPIRYALRFQTKPGEERVHIARSPEEKLEQIP